MIDPSSKATQPGVVPTIADDLFDLPVEAMNMPGLDAGDTNVARAPFELTDPRPAVFALSEEPGEESADELFEESVSDSADEAAHDGRRRWILFGALVLGSALSAVLFAPKKTPAPSHADEPVASAPPEIESKHTGKASAAETLPAPVIAEAKPVIAEVDTEPVVAKRADPAAIAHDVKPRSTAHEAPLPAASRSGREQLQTVESALGAGRRALARVEIGRLLLDVDALPANEREDLRAEAELLAARTLQDAADEARRTPR